MAEASPNNAHGILSPSSSSKSPDSDVSPHTHATVKATDYFSDSSDKTKHGGLETDTASPTSGPLGGLGSHSSTPTPSDGMPDELRRMSLGGGDRPPVSSRKSSTASVAFRQPRNPSLPQGNPRKTDNRRLRQSSPSPVRFRPHVGFDNLAVTEATKNNASSLTLHVRHQGYQPSRRSRTFMVGVDEHAYSDYALVWLLNNMVDDGDEVVCVRVLESFTRPEHKDEKKTQDEIKRSQEKYQEDAKTLLAAIEAKNTKNKAISIVLEYSAGKLHSTFQQLLHIYQPSMLVVGTKGRSLGGIQGLMNTRNSFSKYCLQYSPVPVVVVRPDEKRQKKKDKRSHDPARQSYINMLAHNDGKHEADSEASSIYELEKGISADEEAHKVAAAIGLPAAFDPTIKPYDVRKTQSRRSSPHSLPSQSPVETSSVSPIRTGNVNDSGDDDSGDDDEYEIEAVSAEQLSQEARKRAALEAEQKKRLHAMEVGEAAALLKSGKVIEDDDDDDESQERSREPSKS